MTRKRFQKKARALFVNFHKAKGTKCSEKTFRFYKMHITPNHFNGNYAEAYAALEAALRV